MAQPTITMLTISPNQAAWEGNVNTNYATLKAAFEDNPLIVAEHTLETNLPSAASWDSSLGFVVGETGVNVRANGLYGCDGINNVWRQFLWLGKYCEGTLLLEDTVESMLQIRRYANSVGNQNAWHYQLNDSANAAQSYARSLAEIRVNTAASEEGDYVIEVVQAGSLVEATRVKGSDLTTESKGPFRNPVYTVAGLPTGAAGMTAFASDGRKNGEGAGLGTGVLVFHDGTNWCACDTGVTVAA